MSVGGGGVSVGGSGVSVGGSGVSVGGSDVSVGGGGERTPQAVSAMVIITNDRKRMANFCCFIAGLTFSFSLPTWAKRPQYSDHGARVAVNTPSFSVPNSARSWLDQ